MSELSPAARSVFESFNSKFEWVEDGVPGTQFKAIAAALRAAADQVVPKEWPTIEDYNEYEQGVAAAHIKHRNQILAIADELETQLTLQMTPNDKHALKEFLSGASAVVIVLILFVTFIVAVGQQKAPVSQFRTVDRYNECEVIEWGSPSGRLVYFLDCRQ